MALRTDDTERNSGTMQESRCEQEASRIFIA
jgi:hypothetical protein